MKYTVADLQYIAQRAWVENDMVCILLTDHKEIRFPVYLNDKLRNASSVQLNNLEIICSGTGLHWPDLDEDLSVVGIMEGRYGRI
jgi:hypothetical protein